MKNFIPEDLLLILNNILPNGFDENIINEELKLKQKHFEEKYGDKHESVRKVFEYYLSLPF